jgi:hypothetical protein
MLDGPIAERIYVYIPIPFEEAMHDQTRKRETVSTFYAQSLNQIVEKSIITIERV